MIYMNTVQNKDIKLSDKQKGVIKLMREGVRLHYVTGYNAQVFLSGKNKLSFPTFFKLRNLALIEKINPNNITLNETYQLTELGKNIKL